MSATHANKQEGTQGSFTLPPNYNVPSHHVVPKVSHPIQTNTPSLTPLLFHPIPRTSISTDRTDLLLLQSIRSTGSVGSVDKYAKSWGWAKFYGQTHAWGQIRPVLTTSLQWSPLNKFMQLCLSFFWTIENFLYTSHDDYYACLVISNSIGIMFVSRKTAMKRSDCFGTEYKHVPCSATLPFHTQINTRGHTGKCASCQDKTNRVRGGKLNLL